MALPKLVEVLDQQGVDALGLANLPLRALTRMTVPQSSDLLLLPRTAEQTRKGTLLAWLKRLDHGLRQGGPHQLWIGSPKMPNRIPINSVANRSISISLEEELLAQLDAHGSNRSALVSQALSEWLARRRIDALNTAYAHLASLQDGDLAAAGDAAAAMGEQALAAAADG